MKYLNVFAVFILLSLEARASSEVLSFDSRVKSSKSGYIEFLVKHSPSSKQTLFSSKALGIGLELPSDSDFDFSKDQEAGGTVYRLIWEKIKGMAESSGACGDLSEKILATEKVVLDKAKSDSDVKGEFEKTRFARQLQFLKNGDLKIVFGMSKCLGLMEQDEKIGDSAVPFFAIFFHDGRYFYLETSPDYHEVKAREFESLTDNIAHGNSTAPAAKQWVQFKKVVHSLKLVR